MFVAKCFACHSSALKAPMSGLTLDRSDSVAKVKDRLVTALKYTDPRLQMPPTGKLPDAVIADFEAWIDSRNGDAGRAGSEGAAARPAASAYKGMSLEDGRKYGGPSNR